MPLTYPNGKPTCSCGNNDQAKFKPVYVKAGQPLAGINIKCLACGVVHDMSKKENQRSS